MDRVVYSSNAVLVSDSPGFDTHTGLYKVKALDRVQSANVSLSTSVKRIKHIGYDEHLFENYYPNSTVSCEINFYNSDSSNESILGLNVEDLGIFYGFNNSTQNKNLFLLSDNVAGRDLSLLNDLSGVYVFGIGDAYITNYSIRGSISDPPNSSVSFVGKNMFFDTYTGINAVPSLNNLGSQTGKYYSFTTGIFTKANYVSNQNSRPVALRPCDVFVRMEQPSFAGGIYQTVTGKIQNFEIDIPFPRKELVGFGQNYFFDQKLLLPAVGTVSFNALFETPNNNNYSGIFDFSSGKNIDIELQDCSGTPQIRYRMENAKIVSENFNFAIGPQVNFGGTFQFEINARKGFKVSGISQVYDSDAFAFLQASIISDTTIRTAVNEFVGDLKYYGLWEKMSGIYPFVGNSAHSHQYNLKDPRNDDSAFRLLFSGSGTSHTSSGVIFSGSNDYANTYFNPTSDLSGNPVHISALFLTDVDSSSVDIGCATGGNNPRLLLSAEASGFGGAIFDCYDFNTGRCVVTSPFVSQAFYAASRVNNTSGFLMLFRDSTVPFRSDRETGNISGLSKPNLDVYIGALNTGNGAPLYASASNRSFGFVSIGDGLTSGECVDLYSAVKTFQNNLGRNSQIFV